MSPPAKATEQVPTQRDRSGWLVYPLPVASGKPQSTPYRDRAVANLQSCHLSKPGESSHTESRGQAPRGARAVRASVGRWFRKNAAAAADPIPPWPRPRHAQSRTQRRPCTDPSRKETVIPLWCSVRFPAVVAAHPQVPARLESSRGQNACPFLQALGGTYRYEGGDSGRQGLPEWHRHERTPGKPDTRGDYAGR